METGTLSVPTPDGTADAFAAFPAGGGPYPGILMYPDGLGIRPVLREMAQELAGHGYYVLVPNVFYRHGPTPVIDLPDHIGAAERPQIMGQVMPLIEALDAERVRADAEAYLRFLADRPQVSAGPVGVTGYCFGGLLAVRTAVAYPQRVAALAAFHAPVAADGTAPLAAITAPIHFGHAASDLTPAALTDLNAALTEANLDHTSEIYPDTEHGFTMSDTDAFSEPGLKQHWDRLLPLLERAF
ncbi:dienelactone hydrolase family protein [Streptomyces xanthii]|uniref:dienelactone hydrolase family protein n=1 Tax=Streptomyces xanthii TaxID=2768069 RepID=UPI001CB770FA|nr:dienelactone hydrolase family protein [Streptomyces xanthii]